MTKKTDTPAIRFKGFSDTWEQRKLGDVVQITMGQSPDGSTYSDEPSDYILVQGNADLQNGWVCPRIWTTQITKKADAGDLIMSVRAPAGAMGKTAYNAVIGRGVAAIKGNEFIYQLLVKMDADGFWKILSCGSTFESLNSENIKNAEVKIPTTAEQIKIGGYFQQLDHLITLHQREYEKLHNIKKSMLEKMFPKNGSNVPEIRFKGFTEAWEQRKLGEVLSILKDGTHGTHQDAEEGPYLLSAKNIKNGQIIIDDSSDRKISEDEFNQIHTKFTLENGDILLTIVGSIGESAILENAGKFTFQRSVAFLRPSEEMTSRFLKTEIESVQFQKELNDRKSQSAQPGVYLGDLSKIPIYITSKEEQKKIGEYFSNLDHLITLHQRELEKLQNIKKSMLEKMFVSEEKRK